MNWSGTIEMKCHECGKPLGGMEEREAYISFEIMGDECIESYWFCDSCNLYIVESYHDRFCGKEESHQAILPAERGRELVTRIRQCPEPWNKRCRCPVHADRNR